MKIVIILPTYNERENIMKMIPFLEEQILPKIKQHDVRLLIVDDRSPDGTGHEVRKFMQKWKNIELLEGKKQGLGAAYVRGMRYAMDKMHAEAVMEFDADFQHNPQDIPRLIQAMDEGADYVIGSRYIPGGSIPQEWGFDRKFLSVFGSLFTRVVWLNFAIHDMTSGFKLARTSFLKKVDLDSLYSYQFAYKMHILHDIVKSEAVVKEVPITFLERKKGASKISKRDQFDSLYVVGRLALKDRKRFIKFLFVGGTGFIIQYIVTYISILLGSEQFIAAMIGGELAILSNFLFNNLWTFRDTKQVAERGNFFQRMIKFNTASLASIGVQGFAIYLAVKTFGEKVMIFGYAIHTSLVILFPTIIFLVIPMNYLIYNKLIWKTHRLKQDE